MSRVPRKVPRNLNRLIKIGSFCGLAGDDRMRVVSVPGAVELDDNLH